MQSGDTPAGESGPLPSLHVATQCTTLGLSKLRKYTLDCDDWQEEQSANMSLIIIDNMLK